VSSKTNMWTALISYFGDEVPPAADQVLDLAHRRETITFDQVRDLAVNDSEEILLFSWSRKLLIPQAFSRCGEWDHRILQAEPGEVYELPNISRYLLKRAADTGRWDIRGAVSELYRHMEEPCWEKMADLVDGLTRSAVNYTVTAAIINAACVRAGIIDKTGAMIAMLKGGGIISPKLAALGRVIKSRGPLYELNPSVYPR
jgi:hypothetical protein